MSGVRAPLHVGPLTAAARYVIAQAGTMLIGRHLQPDDCRPVQIDNDALDGRYDIIAGKRILPGLQGWMPNLCLDQIHLANSTLVLLKGRNLLGIRRPQQDWAIAADPARIVRRITEVLHAIGSDLRFLSSRNIADPEVPISNERGALLVRRPRL